MAKQFIVGGKFLGEFDGNVFRKKVQGSKHLMRKYDAWGIDKAVFDEIRPELQEIRIYDIETETLYFIDADVAVAKKIVGEFEGFGLQVFIPRNAFDTRKHLITHTNT